MINPEILGYIAGTLTTISFIPQAVKIIKTGDTKSLSLNMYLIFTIGVALWLIYGLLIKQPPIIAANVITLVLASFILLKKLHEKK